VHCVAGPWFKVHEVGQGWARLEESKLWFSTGDHTFRGYVESKVEFADGPVPAEAVTLK
jgi:hypothetical protein